MPGGAAADGDEPESCKVQMGVPRRRCCIRVGGRPAARHADGPSEVCATAAVAARVGEIRRGGRRRHHQEAACWTGRPVACTICMGPLARYLSEKKICLIYNILVFRKNFLIQESVN